MWFLSTDAEKTWVQALVNIINSWISVSCHFTRSPQDEANVVFFTSSCSNCYGISIAYSCLRNPSFRERKFWCLQKVYLKRKILKKNLTANIRSKDQNTQKTKCESLNTSSQDMTIGKLLQRCIFQSNSMKFQCCRAKKLLVCCFKKGSWKFATLSCNVPWKCVFLCPIKVCFMSHERVSCHVSWRGVLSCLMKGCLVMSHERVSSHVPGKGVLSCPMKECLVMSHERVSCHVPRKGVLLCPTKGCLVMSNEMVSCHVPWKNVLSCPMTWRKGVLSQPFACFDLP